ncbi:MAG TPA: RidA family protein [Rhodanobacteraceae bacterium]|nr:RidA family protein [Rhodanobacteraceae bacterium]
MERALADHERCVGQDAGRAQAAEFAAPKLISSRAEGALPTRLPSTSWKTATAQHIRLHQGKSMSNAVKPQFLDSGKVLKGNFPFSEAVKVGNVLYLSGQVGIVPDTQQIAPGGIEPESRQVMQNIRTVLEAHGYAMDDLIKCTVFLADMAEWPAFNEIYKTYLKAGKLPARSALGVNGLALGARVEVECIASK